MAKSCTICSKPCTGNFFKSIACSDECKKVYIENLTHKDCKTCKETKELLEFGKQSKNFDGLSNHCRDCVHLKWQIWYYKNHDRSKIRNIEANKKNSSKEGHNHKRRLSRYGLSQEEYEKLLRRSNGLCEICEVKAFEVIDHCHFSGLVRGLLCSNCNLSLGGFKDDPKLLSKAAKYVIINSIN